MNPSRAEILSRFDEWLVAWNKHNLEGVMSLLDDDIIFEHWTGETLVGKNSIQISWTPWFLNHGNFEFISEEIFFDDLEQKMLFMWRLEWPSVLKSYKGKQEIRRGVDIIHFMNGRIIKKYSYSKTTIQIEGQTITLNQQSN
jgi:hypothetical protein